MGITWAEAALATIAVALRAYSAARLVKKADWDLFWVIVAWVVSMVGQCMLSVSVAYGSGNHITDLTMNDIIVSTKWSWFGQICIIFSIGFGKIAVIALLLRVQGPTHVKKSWILHAVWITNTILNISQTTLILLGCKPVEKVWNNFLPGNCSFRTTTSKVGYFQGSWAAASDVVLATYPFFIFWTLNLSWKRKLALCSLMGGGYIAAIAGIMKTIYIKLITTTEDVTYAIHPLLIWAFTECWLIIILGSIPQLRVVFVLVKDKASLRSSSNGITESSPTASDVKPHPLAHIDDVDRFARRFAESTTVGDTSTGTVTETTAARTESEEYMLPPLTQIVVTNSYSVTYDERVTDEEAQIPGRGAARGNAVND